MLNNLFGDENLSYNLEGFLWVLIDFLAYTLVVIFLVGRLDFFNDFRGFFINFRLLSFGFVFFNFLTFGTNNFVFLFRNG